MPTRQSASVTQGFWHGALRSSQKRPGPPGAVVEMQQSCSFPSFTGQFASVLQTPGTSALEVGGRTVAAVGFGGGITGPLASMPRIIGSCASAVAAPLAFGGGEVAVLAESPDDFLQLSHALFARSNGTSDTERKGRARARDVMTAGIARRRDRAETERGAYDFWL